MKHGSNRHPNVEIFPNTPTLYSVSSLTAKLLERGARFVNATGHRGTYVVRASGLVRTYIAQDWVTGFEFKFASVAALRFWLSKQD